MQIEIPEPIFKRLQTHATPLVDTTLTVIVKLLDSYENNNGRPISQENSAVHSRDLDQFDPDQPPDLLHTRVRGEFGTFSFSNWNDLLRVAHVEAFKRKAKSFAVLRTETAAQIREGRYLDEGYRYLPEIGISLQGVDANRAWKHALRLARYLRLPLRSEVEWRQNDKAAYPGKRGVLAWSNP